MKKYFLLMLLATLFCQTAFAEINRDKDMEPANGFFLPQGDAISGKKAFEDLRCNSCHWVQNEISLSAPVADKAGPMLGVKQAGYASGWIANSIVSPSHTIAYGSNGQAEGSDLSRMGDFTETMTVRQMINIVAYIKSLGDDSKKA